MLRKIFKNNFLDSIIAIAVISVMAIGCSEKPDDPTPAPYDPQPIILNPQETIAVNASNSFAFNIFDKLNADDSNKNIIFSPLSISYALSMLLNGAEGETQKEIIDMLGQSELTVDEINNALNVLTKALLDVDSKVTIGVANSIWTKEGYDAKEEFIETLQKYYAAQVKELKSTAEVNSWVKTNTDGMITKILDQLDPDLIMLLINAIYFEAEWYSGFDEGNTSPDEFYLSDGNTSNVQMMRQTQYFKLYHNDNYDIVELPYGRGNYAMDIVLPATNKDLDDIISEMSNESFSSNMTNATSEEVTVVMPRFKYEYEKKLNEILQSLGMIQAFDGSQANFSNLMDVPLCVDFVKHKAYIETKEKGTKAAAVTVVGMRVTSAGPGHEPYLFNVNHPFAYVIRETSTNTIVFMGKVVDPNL